MNRGLIRKDNVRKISKKRKEAFRLARLLIKRFSVGYIAPGSVPSDFGWTPADLEEVANFVQLFRDARGKRGAS
jgi:hypothetical protein